MKEIILDTILDSLKLIPFLFVAFLIIELIEHKLTDKNRYKYYLKGSHNFNDSHKETRKTSQGGITFTYPELSVSDYN